MKEENRGSQMNQESRELVEEWVRYEGLTESGFLGTDEEVLGHRGLL